jgi:hypothetical protein
MTAPNSRDSGAAGPTSSQAKLAITDATAASAWCESSDEAAGAWLCEKYRPLILHIAAREFRRQEICQEVADETLRRALALMSDDDAVGSLARWFARIALQVCSERSRSNPDGTEFVAPPAA